MADLNDTVAFNLQQIMDMEQRYRATFINSLGGFKSVCLVGTRDAAGLPNLGVFNSIVHIGANPPLVGFVMRPAVTERHTLDNILQTGVYTINHLNAANFRQAHQASARYPKEVSEFEAAGLGEEYLEDFYAPYVQQSTIKMGLVFKEHLPFAINNTSFVIGQVTHVYLPPQVLQADGFVDLEAAGTITCSGLDSYHTTTQLARLPYAKA